MIESVRDLSNLDGIVYTFMTERGRQDIGYAEYLSDVWLRASVMDVSRYRLILGRTIFSYSNDWLRDHKQVASYLKDLEHENIKNPLRFFAPSGNEMTRFINDYDNSLCILTAANRTGKTQTMMIKKLLNCLPCDQTWEIFTKHGVEWRPWYGKKELAFATYDLPFHRTTTLPMLLRWIPKSELGVYAPDYKGKGAKQVNINNVPMLPLTCGTNIHFTAMSQGQSPFEGNVKHDWGWDEQGSEAAFLGADARIVEVVDGRHDFALTPHKIEGRPDTGAGSWIHKLFSGENTYGHSVGIYKAQVWDVPDWYFPEEKKEKEYEKWVIEPERTLDVKRKREGDSRFFGNWHEASGLVIDEWDSRKHVIEPFEIPSHWSRFRAVDHGSVHPAACLWAAMSPGGDLFIYRDYLRTGRVPSQIAQDIIEASGNKRIRIGQYINPKTNALYDLYEEKQCGEAYQWTKFDARAFKSTNHSDGILLSKLYKMAGLAVQQGSGANSGHYVPLIKEWFVLDPNKKHFVTGELGAPRIYIFASCTNLIRTIKRWVWVERKTTSTDLLAKESPTKKEDDLCDCLKLIIQGNPRFRGNARMSDNKLYENITGMEGDEELFTRRVADKLTGY